MLGLKEKINKAKSELKKELKIKNDMALPKIIKVVISIGTGSFKDKKKAEIVVNRLAKITGQKPVVRGAKKSISTFKLRQGDPVGYMVTLRGERMYGFLNKLINVAIPRMRDFRGLNLNGIDEMGNFTMGIKEHTIFPETADEDLKDIFGFAVTVVTSAKSKDIAKALLTAAGFPFKK